MNISGTVCQRIHYKIVHNKEHFPALKRLTLRACTVDSFRHQYFWTGGDFCSLFSMDRPLEGEIIPLI